MSSNSAFHASDLVGRHIPRDMENLKENAFSSRLHIHQIHYDAASRSMLDPGFIPLDNSGDARPDWYEFWAIRKYLLTHELRDDHWYGFLSPKFALKTGLTARNVQDLLEVGDQQGANVGLALCHFNQIALFWNCFEQGNQVHPGLTEITEQWLQECGFDPDIRTIVNHTNNFTYCNYVFAKKAYWMDWLKLAEALFSVAEGRNCALKDKINALTRYTGSERSTPMKVFIQERIPAIVLSRSKFKIITTEHPGNHHSLSGKTLAHNYSHAFLAALNRLKLWYDVKRDVQYSNEFFQLRKLFLEASKDQ